MTYLEEMELTLEIKARTLDAATDAVANVFSVAKTNNLTNQERNEYASSLYTEIIDTFERLKQELGA